jgi:hypothetical protein
MEYGEIRSRLRQETLPVLIQRIGAGTSLWVAGVILIAVAEAYQDEHLASSVPKSLARTVSGWSSTSPVGVVPPIGSPPISEKRKRE